MPVVSDSVSSSGLKVFTFRKQSSPTSGEVGSRAVGYRCIAELGASVLLHWAVFTVLAPPSPIILP